MNAAALGSYLFFAQHSFKRIIILSREAMAAIPELQLPVTTSLTSGEIVNCFRASL